MTIVTQLDAKLTMTLEEATVRNMALQCMGLPLGVWARLGVRDVNPLFYAALKFTATNSVGPQWNAEFPLCYCRRPGFPADRRVPQLGVNGDRRRYPA